MSRTPQASFADLSDALTEMVALHNLMQTEKEDADNNLITLWDAQADLAMAAWRELINQQDALRDIKGLLNVTYGGAPD